MDHARNLAKNEEKHVSTCLKPIFRLIPGTQKSGFWVVPDPTLVE